MPPIPDDQWAALVPEINRIARNVGIQKNASPTVRDRLRSDAVSHVFIQAKYFDPAQGKFAAWCQRVLGNLCVDMIRKEAVGSTRFERYRTAVERAQQAAERATRSSDADIDTPETVPQACNIQTDLFERLERHLPPDRRLLLITYWGAVSACGPGVLERWCSDARLNHAADFQRIASLPQGERQKAIAAALGRKYDTVRTQIYRALDTLKQTGFEGGQP